MNTKICTVCSQELEATLDYFYAHKSSKDRLQGACKECKKKIASNRYASDPEYRRSIKERKPKYRSKDRLKYNSANREYFRKIRKSALEHYSKGIPKCCCCGITTIDFLEIDHINNDGKQHRSTFNGSIYIWLRANSYPDGFQILCANCHTAKTKNGKCTYHS